MKTETAVKIGITVLILIGLIVILCLKDHRTGQLCVVFVSTGCMIGFVTDLIIYHIDNK